MISQFFSDPSAFISITHTFVGDLQVSDDVRVLDEPGTVIAVVVPPRAEAEEVTDEAAEVPADEEAEPEVIKKGKEDSEDDGGAGPGKGA